MPAEVMSNEQQRRPARTTNTQTPEPENLPCPRCESTNTKFCYYNNYNLSQPRYFCKSCRRYWTRGGTLRNIPVGGGTRKSSKRSRSSSSSSSTPTPPSASTTQPSFIINTTANSEGSGQAVPLFNGSGGHGSEIVKTEGLVVGTTCSPLRCDVNLNEALPGSFTSLLSAGSSGFLGLSGYGLGLSNGTGFDDVGFGLPFGGKSEWPMVEVGDQNGGGNMGGGSHGNYGSGGGGGGGSGNGGCNTWQFNDGGLMDGGDCFAWPDLAISTPGTGLE